MKLTGTLTCLRRVNLSDASLILEWENKEEFWHLSAQPGPFSKSEIEEFILQCLRFDRNGQERWIILSLDENRPIGALDLFGSDNGPHTAGIGILIAKSGDRRKGYATDALTVALRYICDVLQFSEAECLIYPDNYSSVSLFKNLGFVARGPEIFRGRAATRYHRSLSTSHLT